MPSNAHQSADDYLAPSLSQWQQQGRYFDFHGRQVFWQTAGNPKNPVVLLIHGFPSASWDWRHQWQPLAEKYYVITADMPGFGFSDKSPARDYSIKLQADMFEALLSTQGITHCHLVAHDYGDTVAQELLARQTETSLLTLLSVQLLNGGLFPETHRPVLAQKLLISPLGFIFARFFTEKKLHKTFAHICKQPLAMEELSGLWQLHCFNQGSRVMHKLIRYMQERRRYRDRWVNALAHTLLPLQLINGADDPISGKHMVHRYRELVTDKNIVSLAGVGHYPQLEAPSAVTAAICSFLREHA